ncbi:SelT/SelW/SelH family protein [Candidatus Poribacteria bacterium]|nr:SelT/SelW/SelH family protein [Candidatus Poribacteria bacterium]
MEATLKDEYGDKLEDVNLVPSSGGAFEISVDGKLVYSKLKTGRFPNVDEVTKVIDEL